MSDTTTSLPSGETFNIDSVHSTVSFRVQHAVVATFRGGFEGVSGAYENGVLQGEVPVSGINVGPIEMFKNHLLSADWFDAESHPTIKFKSSSISADGDKLKFVGEFTLKGVTKEITGTGVARGPVSVNNPDGSVANKLGLDITAQVNRHDFGITADGGAGKDVTFDIALELVQA
jgi:polyisoprenoid-binding protein YceI